MKILFVSHLAIGDFVYLQNYLKLFSQKHPNLKIDLLVDEGRGKSWLRRWDNKKSNYVLYDWLESCSFFNKIYNKTGSWWSFKETLSELKSNNYSDIILLTVIRQHKFIKLARAISTKGLVSGFINNNFKYNFLKKYYFKKLDKSIAFKDLGVSPEAHVADHNAMFFEKFLDLKTSKSERVPFIDIPKDWIIYGKLKFLQWDINLNKNKYQKNIFINFTAKNKKRCWSFEKAIELIGKLKQDETFYNTNFIINVMPGHYKTFDKVLKNYSLNNIFLFTATNNFFQLPAIIRLCDLVISVETAIGHLAAALGVPVISLMRKKNLAWLPYGDNNIVVSVDKRSDWIKKISVQKVFLATQNFVEKTF